MRGHHAGQAAFRDKRMAIGHTTTGHQGCHGCAAHSRQGMQGSRLWGQRVGRPHAGQQVMGARSRQAQVCPISHIPTVQW